MEADHRGRPEVPHRGRGARLAGLDEERQGTKALLNRGVHGTNGQLERAAFGRRSVPHPAPGIDRTGADEAVASDRLLPGEDPASRDPDDATHWIAVCSELL